MNRPKLATFGCIVLSIVLSCSLCLLLINAMLPTAFNVYKKILDYPETLYEEYQSETKKMIDNQEFSCKYPVNWTMHSENGKTTLILEVGNFNQKGLEYADYIIATVKNFGTNEQEVTFERSRKSAEEAYKSAKNYKRAMTGSVIIVALIFVIFTAYLIKNAINGNYRKVLIQMLIEEGAVIFVLLFFLTKLNFLSEHLAK